MSRFRVIADGPLDDTVLGFAGPSIEFLPWNVAVEGSSEPVDGIYTYGHPHLDGAMLDRIAGVRVISNYGVGVDHINVPDAVARGIPVANTPNILDGATADAGFALLLAAARRVAEGDRYARSAEFLHYDPGFMLGREAHSTTLGIIGLGNIGSQVARRALGFDMRVLYRNRNRNLPAEAELGVEYVSLGDLLRRSDFVILTCPLTNETHHLIDAAALQRNEADGDARQYRQGADCPHTGTLRGASGRRNRECRTGRDRSGAPAPESSACWIFPTSRSCRISEARPSRLAAKWRRSQ